MAGRWWLDSYARKVRLSRWRGEVLYRWFMLRHRLRIPKPDPTAASAELGRWEVTFTCPPDAYAHIKRKVIAHGGEVVSATRGNPSRQLPVEVPDGR